MRNIIVISKENKILHITNYGLQAEYTVYNCRGNYMYGGILESVYSHYNADSLIKEVIDIINELTLFSEPYIYLYDSSTLTLLSLIKQENNKYARKLLAEYIQSLAEKDNDFYYQERWIYV